MAFFYLNGPVMDLRTIAKIVIFGHNYLNNRVNRVVGKHERFALD